MTELPYLLVPIRLDALYVASDRSVVQAMADFSRLPYFDGAQDQDVNPDVAYVGEAILSPPFQDTNLTLGAGLHLHWALPAALTRGTHTAEGVVFPPVPNRWLVTRTLPGNPGQWMVESDYLYPAGEGPDLGGTTYPFRDPQDQADPSAPPFRYLGRTLELASWLESDPNSQDPDYLRPLTAVGYGEPSFAAFYPNCSSVFGFFDPEIEEGTTGLVYDVLGWYADPGTDVLGSFVQQQKMTDPGELAEAIQDHFQWQIAPSPSASGEVPRLICCYARIAGKLTEPEVEAPPPPSRQIAVGNTGTEALSAYLANAIDPSADATLKATFEDQLEGLLLAPHLEGGILDLGARFEEARHEKGFTAVSGGTLWRMRPKAAASGPADAMNAHTEAQVTLPQSLASPLDMLNSAQQSYDQALFEIESIRRQLFSDWYKYMLCAYPPADSRDQYPAADRVRLFIEGDLAVLDDRKLQTGTVTLMGDDADGITGASAPESGSLAGDLAAKINVLVKDLTAFNKTGASPYKLQRIPAPRFWQPREPVVLIPDVPLPAGSSTDGAPLSCPLLQVQQKPLDEMTAKALRTAIDEPTWSDNTVDSPPSGGHSFLLAWEAEVFPIETNASYTTGFLGSAFTLPEGEPALAVSGSPSLAQGANIYSGRTVLTPYASGMLKAAVETYLLRQLPDDFAGTTDFSADKVNTALESYKPTGPTDPIQTALKACQMLLNFEGLSQSLGGFNAALLGQKQALQLPIADPLGFVGYQQFAQTVSEALQGGVQIAPLPENDFNPIRSGAFEINRLRLIDTFGQATDLDTSSVVTSKTLAPPPKVTKPIWLPPRLVQPARLSFHWLSADSATDEVEANASPASTPICGWLLPNNLSGSLAVYDTLGKALGSIDQQAQWQPPPGPGAGAPAEATDIANPHLRLVVTTLQGQGAAFVESFLLTLDSALETIDPESFAQHESLALLIGRPIAVVRARVNLDLQGLPAFDQGWLPFRRAMEEGQPIESRDTRGFESVQVPVRIGEHQQLNDGLVGYWVEDPGGGLQSVSNAPEAIGGQGSPASIRSDGAATDLMLAPSAGPQTLTLLVDPRGVVHGTSGVLPTEVLSIPPDQFAAALRSIEVTFLTAPVLTGPAHSIDLLLPTEPGYEWSWLEKSDGSWTETPRSEIGKPSPVAAFHGPQALREGWLKLREVPADQTNEPSEPKSPQGS